MAAMASLTQKEHLSKWVIRASENETELMVNKANVRGLTLDLEPEPNSLKARNNLLNPSKL